MTIQEIFKNENGLDHDLKSYPGQQKCSYLKHPSSVSFTNQGNDGVILLGMLQSFNSPVDTDRNINTILWVFLSTIQARFVYTLSYQRHPDSC